MTGRDAGSWRDAADVEDSTALSPEETEGLRPSWIATRADLNAAEAANIATALALRTWRVRSPEALLDDLALRRLHRAMFGAVWTWAGEYRRSEQNLGCDPGQIAVKVRDLCDNAKYWFAGSPDTVDESACRFHHELVAVHPFVNGNGRHARAATDLLLQALGRAPFSWGRGSLVAPSRTRHEYISALRAADAGHLEQLLRFVRS